MEKLTSQEAFKLLIEDVIHDKSDYDKKENKWVWHCFYVGRAAGRIAERIGMDADYATALGYIHDIGRKIRHQNHPIEGYYYMKEKGYDQEAGVCLTHSFVDNDINLTAGGVPSGEVYDFLNDYLTGVAPNIYDSIVQLCDLFCLATGFTTIEKRLLDVTTRKGVCNYSRNHYDAVKRLQNRIEQQLGCSLYSIFPEIKQEDLDDMETDREKLLSLFAQFNKVKKYEMSGGQN